MTWVKPKFEVVDLCSEVTSYLYRREASRLTATWPRAPARGHARVPL